MRWLILLFLPLFASAQEDPARLVERLGSEMQEERARAARALRSLGPAALPALRDARSSKDVEVASRATALVALIETEQALPARLRKVVPDLAERLASKELDWDEAILEVSDREQHPGVREKEIEALLPRALAAVGEGDERKSLILTLATRRLTAVAPHLVPLLSDAKVETRKSAAQLLGFLDPGSAPRIARLLKDSDHSVVDAALQVLTQLRSIAVIPDIAPLLKDDRIWIRMAALQAVAGLGGPDLNRLVVPLLRDPQRDVRVQAAQVLSGTADRTVPPLAIELLADPLPETRVAVVTFLEKVGAVDSAVEILPLIDDGNGNVREAAARALTALQSPVIGKELIALLDRPGEERQAQVLRMLGRLRVSSARDRIAERLDAKAPELRRAAIEALTDLRDHARVPALVRRLEDSEAPVRIAALEALDRLGAEAALPKVVDALQDPECRAAALRVLDHLGARSEAVRIAGYVNDPDDHVRAAARQALSNLDRALYRERLVPELIRQLQDPEQQESALDELVEAEARSALPQFLECLADESDRMRRTARSALIDLGGPEQVPALLVLLRSPRPEVREEAVEVLEHLGTRETARQLRPLLRDPSEAVRRRTANALATLEGAAAAETLEGLLADPHAYVRGSAVYALIRIQARASASKIVPLLKDSEIEIRTAAANAIGALEARELAGELVRTLRNPETNGHGACPYAYAQDAFRRWKSPEVVPMILELLRDPSAKVRSTALSTLEMMEAPVPEKALLALLEDPEGWIRADACRRAWEFAPVELLDTLLDDENVQVRVVAAGSLHARGDARGTAELEKLSTHPDSMVRSAAALSLGSTPVLMRQLRDPDSWVRDQVIRALAAKGVREAIQEIAAHLTGPSRQAAAEALGRLRSDAHAADLARLLRDSEYSVREAAGVALMALNRDAVAAALAAATDRDNAMLILAANEKVRRLIPLEALLRCANDPLVFFRETAIRYLGRLDGPEPRKAVLSALGDPEPDIRKIAVELAASRGDLDPIVPLLRDPNSGVRTAAAGALCRHGRKEAARVLIEEAERWANVDLTPLNALRRPKEWAILVATKTGPAGSPRRPALLRALAESCGLKAEFVLRDVSSGDTWHADGVPVAEAIDYLLKRTSYELLLEEGRIRLLPREESLSFWKAWVGSGPR